MKIIERWPAILVAAILIGGVGMIISRFISPSTGGKSVV